MQTNHTPIFNKLLKYTIANFSKDIHLVTLNDIPHEVMCQGIQKARITQTMFANQNGFSYDMDFNLMHPTKATNSKIAWDELTKEEIGGIGEAIIEQLTGTSTHDIETWSDDKRNLSDFLLESLRIDVKTVKDTRKNISVTQRNMHKYDYILAITLSIDMDGVVYADLYLLKAFEQGQPQKHWISRDGETCPDGHKKPAYYLIPISHLKKQKPQD